MNASAQKLAFASISTVAESVRRKELSRWSWCGRRLDRIEALDSKLNSFYTLFRDDVLAAAATPRLRSPAATIAGRCMGFRSGSRTSTSAAPPPAAQNRSRIT